MQEQVRRALARCLDGQGSTLLLQGESGIGKSRVVDFAESMAHESGHLVLRGQAVEFDTVPYLVWQRPLALLALTTPPTDFEASVLALVVPELNRVLEREVVRATEFDASAMQARLADVVTGMVARSPRGVAFLLEDLHWAGAESLALLQALKQEAGRLRALVLASARPDDQVTTHVAWDAILPISALSEAEVAEHVARLPVPRPERAALASYAYERSEGQPLFLAETLRALAEHAGTFSSIKAAEIPNDLRTGGLMRALRKRLAALPDSCRFLLKSAAAHGRRVDRELLASLSGQGEIDPWIALLVSHAVLRERAGHIEFSHDKLRAAVLEDVPPTELREIYTRIATALEQRADAGIPVVAGELTHYFALAGNLEKEARYGLSAGEDLVHQRPDEAIRHLERALQIATPEDPVRASHFRRVLAEAKFDRGELDEAGNVLKDAIDSLGVQARQRGWSLPFAFLRQVTTQALHLLGWVSAGGADRERSRQLMLSYEKLSEVQAFRGERLAMLTSAIAAINHGDRVGEAPLASLGVIGYAAAVARLRGLSRRYFERGRAALNAGRSSFHPFFFLTAAFAEFLEGRSADARATLLEGHERGRRLGHALGASQCLSALGLVEWADGNFHAMLDCYDRILEDKAYVAEHDAANFGGKAAALIHLGRLDEAIQFDERAAEGGETKIANMAIAIHAGRSFVQAQLGHHEKACEAADRAMQDADVEAMQSALLISLWGPHQAYLAAWEAARRDEPARVGELRKKAYAQVDRFTRFCRVAPVARGFACLAAAQVARHDGQPARARKLLRRAQPLLDAYSQRYASALVHTELARLLPRGSRERAAELTKAKAEFTVCGATPDLHMVAELEAAS
jgi:eukaryotic-like serine/threonine-protein kinase